jgi:hypothetical protein
MPRFGLGPVGRVEQQHCDSEASPTAAEQSAGAVRQPWRAPVELLTQWLEQEKEKGKRYRVDVVLSGRYVRWQILPWRSELSGPTERLAYATLRFRKTYGVAVQDWTILPASMAPGQPTPAAAVDTALLDALRSVCQTNGSTLQSLTPYFSSAFDHWRGVVRGPANWFGTIESDHLTLGLLQGGHWTALQTQRLAADWLEPLPALMAQIAMASALSDEAIPLYLCGDVPTPTPQPKLPFNWLNPREIPERTLPGLRLALGR